MVRIYSFAAQPRHTVLPELTSRRKLMPFTACAQTTLSLLPGKLSGGGSTWMIALK